MHMEDVLSVYHRPYAPELPVICMDEQPVQLVKETRPPLPARPGQPTATDYEYERNGTANIFLLTEPLAGWRKAVITEHRTAIDWAQQMQQLLDEDYRDCPQGTPGVRPTQYSPLDLLLQSLSTSNRPSFGRTLRNPLHAQTWGLAQYRQKCVIGINPSVLGAAHS